MDYIYYNSIDPDEMGLTREDYEDYCDDNNINYEETTDSDYFAWVRDELDYEWEDLEWEIKDYDEKHSGHYYIDATLGLWNGTHSAYKVCDSLWKAVCACIDDMDYIKIEMLDNGTIEVEGVHHDGRNSFTIKKMTDEGYERYDEWQWNPDDDKAFDLNDNEIVSMVA